MIPFESLGAVEGNPEVIAFLERWLKRAKMGQLNYVAAAFCEGPVHVYHDFTGLAGMEFAANYGLDMLKMRIMTATSDRVPPPLDKSVPANRFCWPVTKAPACFDFFAWLIMAEMTRIREKAPEPLRVGFYWGKHGKDRCLQTVNRRQMYNNVIIPALSFVGAVEDESCVEDGRLMERYTFVDIVRACRLAEDVPLFAPSAQAREAVAAIAGKGPYVTATLREAAHCSHRNSNMDEWLRFAEYLTAQGERLIFVRDTSHALDGIDGYETCPAASIDIDVRLALYERAKANLFVANGPWNLALFGSAPWLNFTELNAMDPYVPNTAQWWKEYHGIGKGEQFPWSRPDQRMVWERDTFATMCKAWEQLEPLLNMRKAA